MREQLRNIHRSIEEQIPNSSAEGGPLRNCAEWRQMEAKLLERLPHRCHRATTPAAQWQRVVDDQTDENGGTCVSQPKVCGRRIGVSGENRGFR